MKSERMMKTRRRGKGKRGNEREEDRDWGENGISTYQDGTETGINVRTYIGISIGN